MWSRWVTLVVTIYMMLVAGTLYSYPAWSPSLKTSLGYSVAEVNFIGVCGNAGVWMSLIGGFVLDTYGLRTCCVGAAVLVAGGYGPMVAALSLASSWQMPAALMGAFCLIAHQGLGWMYLLALKLCVNNFPPEYRGKMVGAAVCFFGLSSGVCTQLYRAFLTNATQYLTCLLIGALAMCALCFTFCDMLPKSGFLAGERRLANRISAVYLFGVLLCACVLLSSLLQAFNQPFVAAHPHLLGVAHLLTLMLFLTLLIGCPPRHPCDPLSPTAALCGPQTTAGPTSLGPLAMLQRLDFWLMFAAFFLTIGPAVAFVNNLPGFIVSREAGLIPQRRYVLQDLPHYVTISCLVSMFAVFNTAGRMANGYLSDALSGTMSRVTWLSVVCLIMAAVDFAIATAHPDHLYIWVVPFGFAYGGMFSILPTLTSEMYGLEHFATNWGLVQAGPTLGAFLFSSGVASTLNDLHRRRGNVVQITEDWSGAEVTEYCLGYECYSQVMMIGCVSSLLASLCTILLAWTLRSQDTRAAEVSPRNALL